MEKLPVARTSRIAWLVTSLVLVALVIGIGISVLRQLKSELADRMTRTIYHSVGAAGELQRSTTEEQVQAMLQAETHSLARAMARIACEQTAAFIIDRMPKAPSFPSRSALLEFSLSRVDPKLNGLFCEFGVFQGHTINFIASKTTETIHGFDSFEGLPETWRTGIEKGTFRVSELPKVRDNVKLHKGWFSDSLPIWAKEHPGPLAFVHLDADLYSSTKTVFDLLGDRIVPGTIIQFDEYFNYPGWQEHEFKAFAEFVEARGVQFEYIGYCDGAVDAHQVSVRILSVAK
jgi:hypothetical protein